MGNGSSSRELLSTVRSPLAGGATIPRRDVLRLLGCGTAFLAGASSLNCSRLSNGVSARQEGTPSPAAPAEADLAAALEYDVEKIFRFVSEEVG